MPCWSIEILGRPVAVAVVGPRREAVVHRDRVGDAEVLCAADDVGLLLLEGVLGRVHPDDLETLVAVRVIPPDDVGDRPLAVDAGVGPEVDEHDLAAQRLEVDRRVSGSVEPLRDALDIGGRPAALEFGPAVGAVRQFGVLLVDDAAQVELAQLFLTADLFLQRTRVVGDRALQDGGQVEHQCDGEQDRHHPCGDADFALPPPERGDAFGHPLSGEGKDQQRQGGTDRERQRQRHGGQPDGSGGARDDDGGQHRARARHVQHAERQTQAESASAGTELLLRKLRERLLQQCLELREDESEADGNQRDERDPADRVLRQVQQRQQRRTEQRDDAETEHQAGDHAVGPQGFRQGALGPDLRGHRARLGRRRLAALRAGEEDDGQHRKDARRDAGDQATEEADRDQCEHVRFPHCRATQTPESAQYRCQI